MITLSTHCICGGSLTLTASDFTVITEFETKFSALHTGAGHRLFPSAAEAKKAGRVSVGARPEGRPA